jgi:hypothetical protein
MLVPGKWEPDENGVLTPVLHCHLLCGSGAWLKVHFLIDSGAERTVLSSKILRELDAPAHMSFDTLLGIGSIAQVLTVSSRLKMQAADKTDVIVNGPFFGLPEGREDELSILGRDVLGNFAIILDRPGDAIALLHGRHHYSIHETA